VGCFERALRARQLGFFATIQTQMKSHITVVAVGSSAIRAGKMARCATRNYFTDRSVLSIRFPDPTRWTGLSTSVSSSELVA